MIAAKNALDWFYQKKINLLIFNQLFMTITKEDVLKNLDTVKTYIQEIENKKEETTKKKLQIKNRWTGNVIYESEKTTYKEAAVEAIASGSNLSDSNLSDSNLSDSNLSGSNLSGSNLRNANISNSDLSGSNLRNANISNSDLSGSDLSDSNLSGSDLSDSNLSGSNLSGSNLSGSDLSGSNLSDSDLSGSNLRGSNLRGSDMYHALFYGKSGTTKIKKSQINDFLTALGVIAED
jgi:uncharacterized protein YjbI with pentapeptide repeats